MRKEKKIIEKKNNKKINGKEESLQRTFIYNNKGKEN
jgi:hypothetical protein